MKNKKIITGTILLVLSIAIFVFSLTNHLIELRDMKECANTPGCMYCLPKWVGGTAYLCYFVSTILFGISIFSFVLFVKDKKKKLYN